MAIASVVNPAAEDEQGQRLPGPRASTGGGLTPPPKIDSPLDLGSQSGIISASGLGATRHLNQNQFPQGKGGGEPEEGAAEGAEGAEGAAGLGELADLAPLAALA